VGGSNRSEVNFSLQFGRKKKKFRKKGGDSQSEDDTEKVSSGAIASDRKALLVENDEEVSCLLHRYNFNLTAWVRKR
jgi:hypothetical protein